MSVSRASDAPSPAADAPGPAAEAPPAAPSRPVHRVLIVFAVVALLFAAPALFGNGSYYLYLATLTVIYFLGASGLNLILGYAGQISLAQGAFMGVGGYTVAILAGDHHWPVLVALPLGAVLGFVLGLAAGAPALRVSTHYLAMVTLGIQVIFSLIVTNQTSWTGGALGIDNVPRPAAGPLRLTTDPAFHLFVVFVVMLVLGALYLVLGSPWGRAFKSIRENEMRAWMLGVNVRAYKLLAFAIGCAVAAVAGGLLASLVGYIDPDVYSLNLSFMLLLMVVVGGRGRLEGPLLGAVLVTLMPELLRGTQELYMVIFAAATLLLLMFMPRGLITVWDWAYLRVRGKPAPQLTK